VCSSDLEQDNYGFARWAYDHKNELLGLGAGRHFGEWWGHSIQRGYGLKEKRFSLFNTVRWCLHGEEPKQILTEDPRIVKTQDILPKCCGLVPVLYDGLFSTVACNEAISRLYREGSVAAQGFMRPEGIVVFHTAGQTGFKMTIEKDDVPKSKVKQ
jgi:hypothetical protein